MRLQLQVGVANAIQGGLLGAVDGIRPTLFQDPSEIVLRALQGLAVGFSRSSMTNWSPSSWRNCWLTSMVAWWCDIRCS